MINLIIIADILTAFITSAAFNCNTLLFFFNVCRTINETRLDFFRNITKAILRCGYLNKIIFTDKTTFTTNSKYNHINIKHHRSITITNIGKLV